MENNTTFSESFILGLVASFGALIGIVFGAIRKSRCSNINCCWGLYTCQREVLTHDEIKLEPPSPHKLPV